MKEYKLSLLERETVIRFNENEPSATVYTCSYRLKQKLMEMSRRHPGKVVLISQDEYAAQFLVPKRYVTVYEPYSEERRKKDRERVKTNGFPTKKE